jgi:hypothetical protein
MDVGKKRNHVNNFNFYGEMAEWFKAADCKSVEVFRRRFESCSLQ